MSVSAGSDEMYCAAAAGAVVPKLTERIAAQSKEEKGEEMEERGKGKKRESKRAGRQRVKREGARGAWGGCFRSLMAWHGKA